MRKLGRKKQCADCPGWVEFRIKMAIKNAVRNFEEAILNGDALKEYHRKAGISEFTKRKRNHRKSSKSKRV